MADNSSNILKKLQQHTAKPPANAFDKAWQEIVQQGVSNRMLHQTNEVAKTDEKSIFGQLQDYSIDTPDLDFKHVIQKKRVFIIPKPLLRAASVLLFILAGSVAYLTVFNKKEKDTDSEYTTKQGINEQDNKNNDSVIAANITVSNSSNTSSGAKTSMHVKKRNEEKARKTKIRFHRTNEFLDDNDVLFTLINYREYGRQKLFSKTLANKKITLNKYSYINLSDKMVKMLQEVYLTKKKGRPARKAKRAKKKFEKWKKKDEKYFDKTPGKNPADIIDLSDFLMNN